MCACMCNALGSDKSQRGKCQCTCKNSIDQNNNNNNKPTNFKKANTSKIKSQQIRDKQKKNKKKIAKVRNAICFELKYISCYCFPRLHS